MNKANVVLRSSDKTKAQNTVIASRFVASAIVDSIIDLRGKTNPSLDIVTIFIERKIL